MCKLRSFLIFKIIQKTFFYYFFKNKKRKINTIIIDVIKETYYLFKAQKKSFPVVNKSAKIRHTLKNILSFMCI
jgi:hypothetical protein